jgi:hypothetical protein
MIRSDDVVDDVRAGDGLRFRRVLEQGRGFGAAIAQAVGSPV